MKPMQVLAALSTLLICLAVLIWGINRASAPPKVAPVQQAEATDPDSPPVEEADGSYRMNPFNLKGTGPQPVADVPEIEHDFDRMVLGATGRHEFIIKNTSDVPLQIAKGPVQCKCTVSGLKDREVPPGGEVKIELEWTPAEPGPFSQMATFFTSDPNKPEVHFITSGLVLPEFLIIPDHGWTFGTMGPGSTTQFSGTISNLIKEDFKILKIETSSESVTIEHEALEPEHLAEIEALSGYVLRGTITVGEEAGRVQETITVHTNSEDRPTIELPLSGSTMGPLVVIGPGWFGAESILQMDGIDASQGKQVKLTLLIEPGEQPLEILSQEATPPFVQAQLQQETGGKRERYSLTVNVPANSPKGLWTQSNPGVLKLKTNHPKIQELQFNLVFQTR